MSRINERGLFNLGPKKKLLLAFILLGLFFLFLFMGPDKYFCESYHRYLCMEFNAVIDNKVQNNRSRWLEIKKPNGEVEDLTSTTELWGISKVGDSLVKRKGEYFCSVKSGNTWIQVPFMHHSDEDSIHCSQIQEYCTCD